MTLSKRLTRLEKYTEKAEQNSDPYGLAQMDARTLVQVTKNLLIAYADTYEKGVEVSALIDGCATDAEFLEAASQYILRDLGNVEGAE